MKLVMQKGIAGLGNRLQALGHAIDVAEKAKSQIKVDWRDQSWQTGFYPYFSLNGAESPGIGNPGNVWPSPWTAKNIFTSCPKKMFGDKCLTAYIDDIAKIPANADTVVVCRYNAAYSDRLFQILSITPEVRAFIDQVMPHAPGSYDCWHVRNTDKSTKSETIERAMAEMENNPRPAILITDDIDLRRRAAPFAASTSYLPAERPVRGGVHHMRVADKHDIDLSAIADMFVAGRAKNFHACCPKSSYSKFIHRARSVEWFYRQMERA